MLRIRQCRNTLAPDLLRSIAAKTGLKELTQMISSVFQDVHVPSEQQGRPPMEAQRARASSASAVSAAKTSGGLSAALVPDPPRVTLPWGVLGPGQPSGSAVVAADNGFHCGVIAGAAASAVLAIASGRTPSLDEVRQRLLAAGAAGAMLAMVLQKPG